MTGGDLDDTLNAGTIAIPVTLGGGGGMDTLTGGTVGDSLFGGLGADGFAAGTGNDTIQARNEDVDLSFSCGENAGDTDTVNADLAPNDPVTALATNCEVVQQAVGRRVRARQALLDAQRADGRGDSSPARAVRAA